MWPSLVGMMPTNNRHDHSMTGKGRPAWMARANRESDRNDVFSLT